MNLERVDMIDRVVEIDASFTRIVCSSTVPVASPVFEGHFPGLPILPGVLLIETMAQAAGILLLVRDRLQRMEQARLERGW